MAAFTKSGSSHSARRDLMEQCGGLFDKDKALTLTATILPQATEEDHDARSTHPFKSTNQNCALTLTAVVMPLLRCVP